MTLPVTQRFAAGGLERSRSYKGLQRVGPPQAVLWTSGRRMVSKVVALAAGWFQPRRLRRSETTLSLRFPALIAYRHSPGRIAWPSADNV